jgi:hypothetical protein
MCVGIVPSVWALLLGWDGAALLGGHDSYSFVLQYRDFVRAGADWHPLLYAPDVYGGSGLHNALPILLFYQAWAWLGVAPVLAYNLSSFSLQIIVAFLGVRASQDLVACWRGEEYRSPIVIELSAILLFAFAPFLGWRFGYGHQALICGILVFFGAAALVTAARANRLSFTLLTVTLLAWVAGLSSPGQQIGFYSVLFGGPIALALLGPWGKGGGRRLAVSGLVSIAAIALALPRLLPMLRYATGPDAARSLSESRTTYSYMTSNAADWLSSIPWDVELFPTGRHHFLVHEANYAFGPLLLLVLLVPWKKCSGAVVVALASALLVLALSTNFSPISDWMIAAVSPLGSFRVPSRAMVVLCAFLVMVAIAAVIHATSSTEVAGDQGRRAHAVPMTLSLLGALALSAFGATLREVLVWGLVLILAAVYWGARMHHGPSRRLLPHGRWILVPLAVASVLAFEQRLTPFATQQDVETVPTLMRTDALNREPRLGDPLTRTVFKALLDKFFDNTGWATDISTVAGYWVPPRRFQRLEAASRHEKFDPNEARFTVSPEHGGFEILRHLYNICCVLQQDDSGLRVTDLGTTIGPAWFSASASQVQSFSLLVNTLEKGPVEESLRKTLWAVRGPDVPDMDVLQSLSNDCASSRVLGVDGGADPGQVVRIRYQSTGRCPLTASMNFLSQLSAWVERADGTRQPVALFPSYGSLTGAIVPAGERTLVIASVAARPWWRWALYLGGGLCFLFACVLARRWRA